MNSEMNKTDQVLSLKKHAGKGVKYLTEEAYRIVKNPILVYDIDWRVLAYGENDAEFWGNFTHNGMIKREVLELYIREDAQSTMANQCQVIYLDNEQLNHHGIFGKLYDRHCMAIGCVTIVEMHHSLGDDDVVAVKALCKILSKEIEKIPYYRDYSQLKVETYIRKLIDDDIKDKEYATGYIEMIYKYLKNYLYVAVADISSCDPTYQKMGHYRDLFKRTRPAFKYSIYDQYIVMIMSTDETIFYPRKGFNRLNKIFEQTNIKVGVSGRFENLFDLRKYYHDAITALRDGLKANSRQYVFAYGDKVD